MRKQLTPAERLIVAADFDPDDGPHGATIYTAREDVRQKVLALAHKLQGTGVIIKVNSVLRACGYGLIDELHSLGLKVFADLKLTDVPDTLKRDGRLLAEAKPEILTVMGATSRKSMEALREILPNTEILGVTVLTSIDDAEASRLFGDGVREAVQTFAHEIVAGGLDGVICAPKEVEIVRPIIGDLTVNTPNVRPRWYVARQTDTQNLKRSLEPGPAIKAGIDRLVIGQPIAGADDQSEALKLTLDEIEQALVA